MSPRAASASMAARAERTSIIDLLLLVPWLTMAAGNLVERQGEIDCAELYGFLRHAEHNAAGFVLGDGFCACLVHFLESARTVVAHASHDDAECVGSGEFRHGAEQDVDRGSMAIDQRAICDIDDVLRAVTLETVCLPPGAISARPG